MRRKRPRSATRHLRTALAVAAVTAVVGGAGAAAAATLPASPLQLPTRPASVLAKLEGRYTPAAARALAARHGLTVLRQIPTIGWVELGLRPADQAAQRRALLADALVGRIDYERPKEALRADFLPRDPLNRSDITGPSNAPINYHWAKANFFGAWDRSMGSANVQVAVIDSEFDTENPDLKAKLRQGWNVDSGTPEYHTANVRARVVGNQFVEQLHGSHTAGLVAASTDNNILVSGACFECTVIPVKIGLGSSGDAATDAKFIGDLVEGIIWATDHGASAISMSLGTPRFSQSLQDAVNYAAARGVVLVASSGNSQESPTNRGIPQYPAALQNIIAVAATGPDDAVAPFSTNGDFVDVAAPGVDILSTWDTRANGIQIGNQVIPGAQFDTGTSMSTPIVAGLVGLIRAKRPDLTPAEVEGIIEGTARDLGAIGKDQVYGWGLINADAAVAAAIAYVRPTPPTPPAPAAAPPPAPAPVQISAPKRAFTQLFVPKVPKFLVAGRFLVITGRTKPAARGIFVRLQKFRVKGGGWTTIRVAKSNSGGRFNIRFRPQGLGGQRFRLLIKADNKRVQSTSRVFTVKLVKPKLARRA